MFSQVSVCPWEGGLVPSHHNPSPGPYPPYHSLQTVPQDHTPRTIPPPPGPRKRAVRILLEFNFVKKPPNMKFHMHVFKLKVVTDIFQIELQFTETGQEDDFESCNVESFTYVST